MILVINLGLKSVRAIVFDRDGRKRRSVVRPVRTVLKGVWVEQDAEEWWELALEVVREATIDRDIREAVSVITVTSSSCCLVCVDSEGNPLRSAMMVSDNRAVEESARLTGSPAMDDALDANPNLGMRPSMMLPKLMWLSCHEPAVIERSRWFLSSNDYLVMRLTGEVVTDNLNAEKFCYVPGAKGYHAGLLAEAGVPGERLPRVVDVGTDVGEMLPAVKTAVGFGGNQKMRVLVSTYDAICAFFGSGVSEEGDACDVSGTVTSLRVLSTAAPPKPSANVFTQRESLTGVYINGGSNNLGGGLIEWAKQCLYRDEARPYEAMEAEAGEVGLGAEGLMFLPYLMGERAPLWDMDVRGVFFGLERRHSRKHLARAVFESTALSLVYLKEEIEGQGCEVKTVSVSGGLARIKLISRIKADVFEKEVRVPDEFETTSVGAFLLCSLALGRVASLAEAKCLVPVREVIQPDGRAGSRYRELAAFYKDLYQTTVPLFRKRKELLNSICDDHTVWIENL